MGRTTLALAMVCLFSQCCWPQNNNASGADSKLLALESVWNQAEEKGDTRALSLIFDDSMIYVDEDGSLETKAQFLTHAKEERGHPEALSTAGMTVHVYGEMAVIVGNYRATGSEHGKPYLRDGRFIDIWVFKRGVWLCVAAQATPVLR